MSLKEKLKHFWNVTLGEDYPTESNLEQQIANDPSLKELEKSQGRINQMEANLGNSNAPKGGKGNSRGNIVEQVVISPEAVKQLQQIKDAKVPAGKNKEDKGMELGE